MTFNDEVFDSVCAIWPKTSVRSISKAMGRSAGYWSSVKAQNLHLSTGALMNLTNTLETQILIARHAETQKRMVELKKLISRELVQRFIDQIEADEGVFDELSALMGEDGKQSFNSSLPMPFVISTY